MTVGRVYWLFDAFVNYVRITNPFGSSDDETKTSTSTSTRGEVPIADSGSMVDFAAAMVRTGMNSPSSGITVHNSIDEVRSKNPLLADFLEDFKKGEV